MLESMVAPDEPLAAGDGDEAEALLVDADCSAEEDLTAPLAIANAGKSALCGRAAITTGRVELASSVAVPDEVALAGTADARRAFVVTTGVAAEPELNAMEDWLRPVTTVEEPGALGEGRPVAI